MLLLKADKNVDENIASEYGQYNIQCNGIGPGYIRNATNSAIKRETQENGERHPFDQFIVGRTPAARWGDPIDLAGTICLLSIRSASDFVNGHILYVDGGILKTYIGKQP